MRNLSHTSNLYNSGYVSLIPSSTYSDFGEYERTSVDTILEETYDYGRFITGKQDGFPYIIVNMKNSYINLTSYTFYIRTDIRFTSSWDLYGMYGFSTWKLIDSRINVSFSRDPSDKKNFLQDFTCQFPNIYNKFKIQATSTDNYNQNRFTLSRLYFFGGFYPNLPNLACTVNRSTHYMLSLHVFVLIVL